MQLSQRVVLALLVALLVATQALADDPVAREWVEKGIQAQGGRAALERYTAGTGKIKGTIHALSDAADFSGEVALQGSNQHRFVIDTEVAGQKLRIASVLNRDKAWTAINDETEELEGEDLSDTQEDSFGEWVATLTPLNKPEFSLALVGEVKVENRPAMGVTASSKGHRDVNLYFDKETGLLVKSEKRVKDETTRQEVTEETFLSEYKDVQGTKQAMRLIIKRDGKRFLDGELSDVQLVERLDDSVFAKP